MDPNAAPWRALESASPAQPAADGTGEPERAFPLAAIAAVAVAALLAIGAFVLATGTGSGQLIVAGAEPVLAGSDRPVGSAAPPTRAEEIVVDVTGAVVQPGVYRLPAGARVGDAIAVAGGYGPRLDTDRSARELNLAAPLADGDQVRVPVRGESPAPDSTSAGSGGGSPTGSGLVDLNAASASELESLPGIGEVTAAKIIAAREEQPFATVDELLSRKVVGPATLEKIRELVMVR